MSYIVLAGPALAIDPSASRVFSCIETDSGMLAQLASVEVNTSYKTKKFRINTGYGDDKLFGYMLSFLTQILKQYTGESIVATDTNAIIMVTALNDKMRSTNPDIVKAWTALKFVVECEAPNAVDAGKPANKVRFVGQNIAGLKHIVSASSVVLTITAA